AGTIFNKVVFPDDVIQNFGEDTRFGQGTYFGGANQTFAPGTTFDKDTIFAKGQPMPANVVLSDGLLLQSINCDITCSSDSYASTDILLPGEILQLNDPNPDPLDNLLVTSTDNTINIPGLQFTLSFAGVDTDGTVSVDIMKPQEVATLYGVDKVNEDGSIDAESYGIPITSVTSIIDISTETLLTSDTIQITLPYPEMNNDELERKLKMIHHTGGVWMIEDSCTVDTVGNDITCTVTSLSPFGIGSSSASSSYLLI
ncbi:MAG: hypothetical protein CK527_04315, partial [Nitrosarchaeum sp.]